MQRNTDVKANNIDMGNFCSGHEKRKKFKGGGYGGARDGNMIFMTPADTTSAGNHHGHHGGHHGHHHGGHHGGHETGGGHHGGHVGDHGGGGGGGF